MSPDQIAREIAGALETRRQIAPFSARGGLDAGAAYAAADALRHLRGGRVVGRKIGFTNRTIWPLYGVDAPMWGDMTEDSVHRLDDTPIALAPFLEPRLEPEVAFGLATSPSPGMDEEALLSAVAWVAPAFEIVQSVYPGWRFTLPDCVAANGLHGALHLGPAIAADAADFTRLPGLTLRLEREGETVATGRGADVLDGPLTALRHLVDGLGARGEQLSPGDIVTTGTLTDAQPLTGAATWRAVFEDSPLGEITARFAAE